MPAVHPTDEQTRAVLDSPDNGPIVIVNLVRYKEKAAYAPDSEEHGKGLSGRQAYLRYADEFMKLMADHGARSLLEAETETYLIGEGDWDLVWTNYFPSRDTFRAVVTDPRYQAFVHHRLAGLESQDAIVTRPMVP